MTDDENYWRWVQQVCAALIRDGAGSFYPLDHDELQWAERAVAEGQFSWAPNEFGLSVPAAKWPPQMPRIPSIEETWLSGVLAYLHAEPGRSYTLARAELRWARQAITEHQLDWEREDLSVRLPRSAPTAGPYR